MFKSYNKKNGKTDESLRRKAIGPVNIMKNDIVHFLRILKLHRYLKRAKLRYGNAVTADILW